MEILNLRGKNFGGIIKKKSEFIAGDVLSDISSISLAINEDKVIVLPTDTIYGLVADATSKKAVEKLFKIKRRKKEKPIPIFVEDVKMAKNLALINKEQEKFLKKVWPGKVTAVLKIKKRQKIYGADRKTIGLRVPNYKLINTLLRKLNRPLTGTSANISGQAGSIKIREVINQFKNQRYQPDLIINAGNLPKSRPSKIIDLTEKRMKILRK